mmetsp:Transcript_33612/g.51534  ORF Transcript_33612/g.51534 Transcript_33612/m.51534 type:complete len:238 (+) Transcript_33612:371-1084(+)
MNPSVVFIMYHTFDFISLIIIMMMIMISTLAFGLFVCLPQRKKSTAKTNNQSSSSHQLNGESATHKDQCFLLRQETLAWDLFHFNHACQRSRLKCGSKCLHVFRLHGRLRHSTINICKESILKKTRGILSFFFFINVGYSFFFVFVVLAKSSSSPNITHGAFVFASAKDSNQSSDAKGKFSGEPTFLGCTCTKTVLLFLVVAAAAFPCFTIIGVEISRRIKELAPSVVVVAGSTIWC